METRGETERGFVSRHQGWLGNTDTRVSGQWRVKGGKDLSHIFVACSMGNGKRGIRYGKLDRA